MKSDLAERGHDVNIVAINILDAESSQSELTSLCSFDLLQDVSSVRAWDLMGGHKDDMFIYRPSGVLAPDGYLPISTSTYLHLESGYEYLLEKIIAADELGPVSCTSCQFGIDRGVAKIKKEELSVKIKNAPFHPGTDSYRGDGEEIAVTINGQPLFASDPDRVVKMNRRGTKVTVRSGRNKAVFNLKKKTFTLKVSGLEPPATGDESPRMTIELDVDFAGVEASATVFASGRKWTKLKLEPGAGAARPTAEYTPCP